MDDVEQLTGTKLALIEAASMLFAEKGFDAVSLREITGKAKVNIASVKYHFGSKDALVDAVVEGHVRPVNLERLRRVGELQQKEKVTVGELLRAFFEPLMFQLKESHLDEQLFTKLVGRMMGERAYEFPEIVMQQFRQVAQDYVAAFTRAMPSLSHEDVLWRIHFSFGVVAHALTHGDLLKKIAEGVIVDEELELTFERIMNFCEAGFKGGVCR